MNIMDLSSPYKELFVTTDSEYVNLCLHEFLVLV